MSIFLGYVTAASDSLFWSTDASDFLPFEENGKYENRGHRAGFRTYHFGEVFDRKPAHRNGVVSHVIGWPMRSGGGEADFNLDGVAQLSRLHQDLQGGYVSFVCGDSTITVLNGFSGEHTAYYRQVGDLYLVSNRLSLLLAFGEAELDPVAGGYMAAQGYIYGRRTAFDGISRLMPGDILDISKCGFSLHAPDLHRDYQPIEQRGARDEIERAIDEWVARCTYIADNHAPRTLVPLSGGKDSRAILGGMCVDGRTPEFRKVYTRGHHYSPEVLSAAKVIEMLGLPRHAISRPPIRREARNLADIVLRSLQASEGQFSVFDHAGISQDKRVSVGGHQNSLRETHLPNFPHDLDSRSPAYLVSLIERDKSVNPSGLLSREGEVATREDFIDLFGDFLLRGATAEKTPETFGWMVRTAGWVAVANNALTYAANPVHPLLDRSLMRLAMGLQRDIPESEAIHFLMMARVGKPIWDIPFASQTWSDKLPQALDLLGYRGPGPKNVTPFLPHRAFPDAIHPHLTNEKNEIQKMLARFCLSVFPGMAAKMPWLDEVGVKYVCREDAPVTLIRFIGQKGVFASILCAYFGRDLFRRSTRDRIADEVGSFYTPAGVAIPSELELLREQVLKQEKSIAQFVVERQAEKQPVENKKAVAGKGPWRFADIVNLTGDRVSYQLRKVGSGGNAKPIELGAGEVFSHGVRETGEFEVIVQRGGDVIRKTVSFSTGEFAKVVRIS